MSQLERDDLVLVLTTVIIDVVAALAPDTANEKLEKIANSLDEFARADPSFPPAAFIGEIAKRLIETEPLG